MKPKRSDSHGEPTSAEASKPPVTGDEPRSWSPWAGSASAAERPNRFFLAIDHVNDNGREHRAQFRSRHAYWNDVLANLADFQCLCHNCNHAKQFAPNGCPHQEQMPLSESL